ncbi:NAD(P)-dependent alcohol dehydrogenase [Actinomadura madurae]|uniref:NAD(P)-dependent alcohol dehydrogenase n=1 Tax=Actinomadura madurae TaxID=1993 RepID=UPI0020269CB2|nr:NAD(P)-dependent alcohol dehydrogenase [Actinomadura madurae]URM99354.1 NAD(P)-dependent alcohol dehydrogenase [Actinomadura madurae]
MKAAVRSRYGPPELVRIAEVDTPAIGDGDVLVKVHATTVNRTDCSYRAAKPFFMRAITGLARPRRRILGTEYAGVVEAVGADVTSFAVGDRVFGYNEGPFGAHAEYLKVPQDALIAIMPEGLTFEKAAAGTEGSHYALWFVQVAGVEAGHDVLVYGATGAIGSATVQLLKQQGATVTAVCATAHVELVKGLGADRVVDYTVQDFTQDEQTYDVVFDAVGKSSFRRCRKLLKPRGVYLSSELGAGCQNVLLPFITPLFRGRRVKFPLGKTNQETIRYLAKLMETGEFKPVIDRRYPLEQIVDAYRYVETGQKVGNVVVTIVPPDPS